MTDEKDKPKEKAKEPTIEETRKTLLKEMDFPCQVAEKLKRLKDAGMLDATTEMDMRKVIDENVRAVMGMPPKPVQPAYQPPQPVAQPMPPTQPPTDWRPQPAR
jgi:hypothetical protein